MALTNRDGGGTPRLTTKQLQNIFARTITDPETHRETAKLITNGANPRTLTGNYAQLIKSAGAPLVNQNKALAAPNRLPTGPSASYSAAGIPLAAPQPTTEDSLSSIYGALLSQVRGFGADNLADMDKIKAGLADQYKGASDQLYQQYQNSRTPLDASATALGVNPAEVYKGYDDHLRQIQENSDQSLAQDQAWFDKMKALRSSSLDSLYQNITNDKAMQLANWQIAQAQRANSLSTGSRGGSSHKGGGSSSSGAKTTATDTQTVDDYFDQDVYNQLKATNPALATQYIVNTALGSSNPGVKNAATSYKTLAELPTPKDARPTSSTSVLSTALKKQAVPKYIAAPKNGSAVAKRNADLADMFNLMLTSASTGDAFGIPHQVVKTVTSKKG